METDIKARLAKACPCCGSKNIRIDNPEWIKKHILNMVTIACGDCGLHVDGYAGHSYITGEDLTIQQAYQSALKRWNRRAS